MSRKTLAICSVTVLSLVPSLKFMPEETAVAFVLPAEVVPPVTLGVWSGWHQVLTLSPPLVPCPALTPITMFFLLEAVERYITALPVWIAE
jgi:hypothetical protein